MAHMTSLFDSVTISPFHLPNVAEHETLMREEEHAMDEIQNRRWWILAAMGSILGVVLLDETAVSVALPTIRHELELSELAAHWVVNIYLLALAGLAAAAGRLGDVIGTKSLLIAGLLLFGAASTTAGLAPTGPVLMAARAIQGVGGAIIFPLSLVLVTMSFEEKERGMALGIYGAIGTSFLAAGPLVGGALTEGLSWRWIFWVNPFVVLVVAGVTWMFWRDPPRPKAERFDLTGLCLMVGGLTLLIYGIMEGPEAGWAQADVVTSLSLGTALLVAFVYVETRLDAPLIAVGLFTDPSFAASNLLVGLAQFAKIATFVFGAFYFQAVEGWSPVWAGVALLPAVVPTTILAPVAGRITDQKGTRWPALMGATLTLGGLAATALGMMVQVQAIVFLGFVLFGCSLPLLFVPSQHAVMASVPAHMRGQAGGIVLSSQLIGGTLGMAICSTTLAMTASHAAVFWVGTLIAGLVLLYARAALDIGAHSATS